MAAGVPTATTLALVSGGVAVAVALYFTTQVPLNTGSGNVTDVQQVRADPAPTPSASTIPTEKPAQPDTDAGIATPPTTQTAALSTPQDAPAGPAPATADAPSIPAPTPQNLTDPPEPTTAPTTATHSPEPTQAAPKADSPQFDIVRVETDGSALVAGTAAPGAEITITFGDKTLEIVQADTAGNFVSFLQLPEGGDAQPLRLSRDQAGGARVYSEQTVLIVPPEQGPKLAQPTIVIADASGAEMLQPAVPEAPSAVAASKLSQTTARDMPQAPAGYDLSLETISYDTSGDVVLSGRGQGAQFVRIYVDNEPVKTKPVPVDGAWQVVLPDVDAGVYTLRVDEISETGKVTARVESPFKRETPKAVAQAARLSPTKSSVTVQPGHTLWALALQNYGDGVKYVQIFQANKDRIRNADLIYPGQVFDIPDDG